MAKWSWKTLGVLLILTICPQKRASQIKTINIIFLFVLHAGKTFYYRGCRWKPKKMDWTKEDKAWIKRMNKLFDDLFGPDFCQFDDTETKHRFLVPGQLPVRMYDHDKWERIL